MESVTVHSETGSNWSDTTVTAERIRDKIAASKRRGLWMGGLVPLGYDADGRTLKINDAEAHTIRTLYDLYEKQGTVREVKAAADDLGLRSRQRTSADGHNSGGITFSRGHIHNLLTNPIYAGRIRHKTKVHEGQHEAIIDPERWDRIQMSLQDGAAKGRARKTAKQKSLLCGMIFDETGDRLTPSHSKTKAGLRLRYYVSHRLIKNSGEANKDGWRLPGEELEAKVAHILRQHLNTPSSVSKIVQDASAEMIATAKAKVQLISAKKDTKPFLNLIERIDLSAGQLSITTCCDKLGMLLEQDLKDLPQEHLTISALYQMRKRGVETKLIFADAPGERDDALIKNIATAHHWFEQIKAGKSFGKIAADERTSTRRIHQMIDLALLAPDLIRDVLDGTQPLGFTSDWCLRHSIPSDWSEQRALIATL